MQVSFQLIQKRPDEPLRNEITRSKMLKCVFKHFIFLAAATYLLVFDTISATVNYQSDGNFSPYTSSYNLTITSQTNRITNKDNDARLKHFSAISSNLGNNFSSSSEEQTENKNTKEDVLLKTLRFVNEKSIMDYRSISIILNTENCNIGIICEDILQFLTSSDNDFPFHIITVYKDLTYLNIYEKLKKFLQGNHKVLILIDDQFDPDMIENLFALVEKSTFNKHIWMFVERMKGTLNASTIMPVYNLDNKLDIASQVFKLSGDSEIGILSEMYRKCPTASTKIYPIATINSSRNIIDDVDFIWNRRQNLDRCSLRVAFVHDPPFIYEKESVESFENSIDCVTQNGSTICGSYIKLFKIMLEILNFDVIWVKAEDNKYGSYDDANGMWNGVVGLLSRSEADFSLLHMSVTSSRSKVISFSIPISETEARMYIKEPTYKGSWGTYFEVFDTLIWISIFIMALIVSCLGSILFVNKEVKCGGCKYIYNFGSAFAFFWGTFSVGAISQGVAKKIINATGKSLRIFVLVISVFGMTIFYHYEGKLISFVISREVILPINNLEDILQHPKYQLMVQAGSAEEDYFKLSTQWPKNKLWSETMKNNEKAFVTSTEMDSALMKDEKKILFCTSYWSEMYMPNYPCNIKRLGGSYLQGSSNALGFSKDSPYQKIFSHVLTKIKTFGTWQLIQTRMERTRPSVACSKTEDEMIEVGYKNTFSLFVMLGIGILIAMLNLIFEKGYRLIISKKHLKGQNITKYTDYPFDKENRQLSPTQNKINIKRGRIFNKGMQISCIVS